METILPNGLCLLTIPPVEKNLSFLGLTIGAGSVNESLSQGGISHLLEHALLVKITPNDFFHSRSIIGERGGMARGGTEKDVTSYFLYNLNPGFFKSLQVLIDALYQKGLMSAQLEASKKSVLSEIESTPKSYSQFNLIWQDEHLAQPVIGTAKSINLTTPEELNRFHDKYYLASNTKGVLATALPPEPILHILSQIRTGPKPKPVPVGTSFRDSQVKFLSSPKNSYLHLLFPTKGLREMAFETRYHFHIATTLLKQHFVYPKIINAGLVYRYDVYWEPTLDVGVLHIEFHHIPVDNLTKVLSLSVLLVNQWVELDFIDNDLIYAQKQLELANRMGGSPCENLETITRNYFFYGKYLSLENLISFYQTATLEKVKSAVREVLLTNRPFVALWLDNNSWKLKDRLQEILAKTA